MTNNREAISEIINAIQQRIPETQESAERFTLQKLLQNLKEAYKTEPDNVLYSEKVLQQLLTIELGVRTIDAQTTFTDKRTAFFIDQSTQVLRNALRDQEDEPEPDLELCNSIDSINKRLLENEQVVSSMIDDLLNAQRLNLRVRGIPEDKIEIEIGHIQDVITLCKNIFPDLAVLQLFAAVHDAYKYLQPGNVQVGLHELTSTILGPELLAAVLKKYQPQLELSDLEIENIIRVSRRAIYTHGKEEFPDKNSTEIPPTEDEHTALEEFQSKTITQVRMLDKPVGIQLYIKTQKEAVTHEPDLEQPNSIQILTAALNGADAATGSHYKSMIKYNGHYPTALVVESDLTQYFQNKLFSSFASNLQTESLLALVNTIQYGSSVKQLINDYSGIMATIMQSLDQNREVKRESLREPRQELFASFNSLKTAFTTQATTTEQSSLRKTFDTALSNFITTVATEYFNPQ